MQIGHQFSIDDLIEGESIVFLEVIVGHPSCFIDSKFIVVVVNEVEIVGKFVDSHSGLVGAQGREASRKKSKGSYSNIITGISINNKLVKVIMSVELGFYLLWLACQDCSEKN